MVLVFVLVMASIIVVGVIVGIIIIMLRQWPHRLLTITEQAIIVIRRVIAAYGQHICFVLDNILTIQTVVVCDFAFFIDDIDHTCRQVLVRFVRLRVFHALELSMSEVEVATSRAVYQHSAGQRPFAVHKTHALQIKCLGAKEIYTATMYILHAYFGSK